MSNKEDNISTEVERIFSEYKEIVLEDNPDDIISHAADYFTQLRDMEKDANGNKLTKVKKLLGSRYKRRQSVVGERYNPEEEDDEEEIEVFPKTDKERKKIRERIEDVFLFKHLDVDDKNEIVDAMMHREVEEGKLIIRQGDDGDFFFVVDKGTFVASVEDEHGEEEIVNTYDNSGSFGELALLHNQPRAATITAKTDGALWAVSRKTFNKLVVKKAFDKRRKYMAILDKVAELQPLTEFEKMQVCDALTPVNPKKGDIIFKEGDEGNGMYFVEDGNVSISKKSKSKKGEQEAAKLGPGDYFGEMALMKKQPRAATATALTDAKLAFLEKKGFERLLGPCKDIMKTRMDKYSDT